MRRIWLALGACTLCAGDAYGPRAAREDSPLAKGTSRDVGVWMAAEQFTESALTASE